VEKVFEVIVSGCLLFLVVSFIFFLVVIALSPVISISYLIADWYEKRFHSNIRRTSQGETESSLGEIPKTHDN